MASYWNEDEMCAFRWSVIGDATKEELQAQNTATGYDGQPIDRQMRFFYRVVCLD